MTGSNRPLVDESSLRPAHPTRDTFVAAADIGGTRLRMALADRSGTLVAHWSTVFSSEQRTPAGVCRVVRAGLNHLSSAAGITVGQILHLTAGAPGITNSATGTVIDAPNLDGWHNVPLRALLEHELCIPCAVENDTNLAALGEQRNGVAQGVASFVFLALGTGLGAGLVLDGRLYRGAHWSAGEIGYFGIPGRSRHAISPHRAGQLESAIGGAGIEAEWRRVTLLESEATPLRATQILDLAATGDPKALRVLRYTAAMLANAVADISLLLNPELVVLGGGIGANPGLCRATTLCLAKYTLYPPVLQTSVLGTQAQLFGAVSVSLAAIREHLTA